MRKFIFEAALAMVMLGVLTTLNEATASQPRRAPSSSLPNLVNVDQHSTPAPGPANAITDSLYLLGGPGSFSGKFQDEMGLPDSQGWEGIDLNQVTEVKWQVSTFNAADLDPGTFVNHAWWCGAYFDSCDVDDPEEGYGDNWYEFLDWRGTVPDPDSNVTVRVRAVISYDVEPGEDYLNLQVENSPWMENLASFSARDSAVIVDVTALRTPDYFVGDLGDQIHLRWAFHSDGAWSDEDCRWPTKGAAQIDLIQVFFDQGGGEIQMGSTETCEPGDPLQWQPTLPQGPGDFSKVWPLLADDDPASGNETPQFAFIDDGVVVPGTGGYPCTTYCYGPGGYIVNPERGLADLYVYVHNEIWSPVLAVPPGDWVGAEFSFDHYVHAELDNGGAYALGLWHVRSTADPTGQTGWTEWKDRNYALWGSPRYVREVQNVSDLLVPGFTHVQVALGVRNFYGGISTDGTPAPYFDNVSLKVYESLGPRSLLVRPDGSGEYPTIQTAINAAADHDTVLLADGVFSGEGNRDLYFLGKEITVCSQSGEPRDCIIDVAGSAGDNHRGFVFSELDGPGAVVSGLTITGGFMDTGSQSLFNSGGAIICRGGGAPTISKCVFSGNQATGTNLQGGAISCDDSSPLITDCVFEGNLAVNGGAIGAAGISSPVVSNCLFIGNEALELAGAVYAQNSGVLFNIISCTFHGNINPTFTGTLVSFGRGRFNIDHTILAFGVNGYSITASDTADVDFSCSNIFGNPKGDWIGVITDQLGVVGNINLDPVFCLESNPANPYSIHEDSPCAPEFNPACGLIGYQPTGCGDWSAVESLPANHREARLYPCYPNPFNPWTTLKFSLGRTGKVDLAVYSIKGELVKQLVSGRIEAGEHEVQWNGRDRRGASLASGVYFARLVFGREVRTQRLVLLQ